MPACMHVCVRACVCLALFTCTICYCLSCCRCYYSNIVHALHISLSCLGLLTVSLFRLEIVHENKIHSARSTYVVTTISKYNYTSAYYHLHTQLHKYIHTQHTQHTHTCTHVHSTHKQHLNVFFVFRLYMSFTTDRLACLSIHFMSMCYIQLCNVVVTSPNAHTHMLYSTV